MRIDAGIVSTRRDTVPIARSVPATRTLFVFGTITVPISDVGTGRKDYSQN